MTVRRRVRRGYESTSIDRRSVFAPDTLKVVGEAFGHCAQWRLLTGRFCKCRCYRCLGGQLRKLRGVIPTAHKSGLNFPDLPVSNTTWLLDEGAKLGLIPNPHSECSDEEHRREPSL